MKEEFHPCMMVLSVTHTLLAINCGREEEPSFAAERNGVLHMGKIQKDWVKEKLILWTFWGKCSSVAQLCQLRHQVSPGICSPQHLLTPRQLWLCLCGCPAGHLHIHIFTVTPAPHENAAVLWQRAAITAAQCCCRWKILAFEWWEFSYSKSLSCPSQSNCCGAA